MKFSNKTLGIIAMLAAPGLALEMYSGMQAKAMNTSIGGVCDLVYMAGWMCSIVGLLRLQAAGVKKRGINVLYVQLGLLAVAQVVNVWVIINPSINTAFYRWLDMVWPLSNVWMLVTGIVVAITGTLQGWRRYVPLIAGLWLPLVFTIMSIVGKENVSFVVGGLYPVMAWGLMGWMIYSSESTEEKLQLAV